MTRHNEPTDLDLRFAYAVNDVHDMAYECPHPVWETVRKRHTAGGEAIYSICVDCGEQMTEPA